MTALQRLTTEYIESEDRFRIAGEGTEGELHSFWLSQRLLIRLIRYLVAAIEETPVTTEPQPLPDQRTHAIFNEMAQQVAQQQLADEPPVVDPAVERSSLVLEVDVTRHDQLVKLDFKNAKEAPVELLLNQLQLRQWLSIVYKLWETAEWPMQVWPDWIVESGQANQTTAESKLH